MTFGVNLPAGKTPCVAGDSIEHVARFDVANAKVVVQRKVGSGAIVLEENVGFVGFKLWRIHDAFGGRPQPFATIEQTFFFAEPVVPQRLHVLDRLIVSELSLEVWLTCFFEFE